MLSETVAQDLRIGLRVLRKERSFSLLAIVVLALGICGVTSMFGVVNGVMLRGFSFPNADRLASANFVDPTSANFFGVNGQVFTMDYVEIRPGQQSFERLAAYLNGSTVNVTIDGKPQRYTGAYVTEDFLPALGVKPVLGRDFTAEDNAVGAEKVAIIGYGIWQRDFGGAKDVVGRHVRINGRPATIIGVMEKGFAFPQNEELWLPLFGEFPPRPRTDPNGSNPALLGSLKPGVTVDQANAEFTTLARRLSEAYPDTNKQFNTGQVQKLIDAFTPRSLKGTLLTMLAFCVGVLLIACVNVMNMQFARATLRAKELAVRSSLGATRARLIRQMLTESLLVAAFGAAIGIALAYYATDWLDTTVHNLENPPPAYIHFNVDTTVLAFTLLATLIAAVVSGLLPAWMASRSNANAVLRDGGRGTTSRRMMLVTRGLVVFQIVVTCVLLIGSLLQVRSILNQQTIDYGYDTGGILSARMGLMDGDYPSNDARRLMYERIVKELPLDPAFAAVALTNRFRMVFSGNGPIEIDGKVYSDKRDRPQANFETVTPGFFDVTGQRLVEGRGFNDDDLDSRQAVAIVNMAFARRHFGTASALGRRFRVAVNNGRQFGPWRTIVGVVSTVRMLGPFNNPNVDDSGFYVPFFANPFAPETPSPAPFVTQFATVIVKPRPGQRPESLVAALRRDMQKADPNLPLYFVGTPKSQQEVFVSQNRILATLFSIFGAVAIVLAAVGIYGVMSFAVSQRTQEFGVRMALGANAQRILAMVVRQGIVQMAIGLTAGLAAAFALAAVAADGIRNTLFGVSGRDPAIYVSVALMVTVVSMIATLVPARRATRVDPMIALRAE
ncbi:MAG TPA: ABC transporter permease [Vicinamibacterales bacterium]|nr:ABC transporter permease [Vicinamibacterales bacterium]